MSNLISNDASTTQHPNNHNAGLGVGPMGKRLSVVSAGQDSTSSIASDYYSLAESPGQRTEDSLPSSLEATEEEPQVAQPPVTIVNPTPESIATAIPILKLPTVTVVEEPEPLSPSSLTPRPPRWTSLPPSPTLSTRSSVRFATSTTLRGERERRPRSATTGSLGLLSIGANPHRDRHGRKLSVSSSGGESSSGETVEDRHRHVPIRFARSQFMASQVSTLGTRTQVDEPEDVGQLPADGHVMGAEDKKSHAAVQVVSPAPTQVAVSSALEKVRRKCRLAGRARQIFRRLRKDKTSEKVDVAREVIVAVVDPPQVAAITTLPKVVPVDDIQESRDVHDLRNQMTQMRTRITQVEHENERLREETAALKLAVARTSVEETAKSHTRTTSEDPNQALSDKVQRLEEDLTQERKMREEEVKNLHKVFRGALMGR